MKKTLFAAGLAAAAIAFVPATVSADSYGSDTGWVASMGWKQDKNWSEDHATENGTIVDALAQDGRFTTLIAAAKAAGLADTLNAPGDLTLFAPTDKAFAKLPAGTVEALLQDTPMLTKILTNHVVAGRVDGDTAVEVGEAMALSGNTLNIGYGNDDELYVNDAQVKQTDIMTSNGIVHVINAVLLP